MIEGSGQKLAGATLGFAREKVPGRRAELRISVTDTCRVVAPEAFRVTA